MGKWKSSWYEKGYLNQNLQGLNPAFWHSGSQCSRTTSLGAGNAGHAQGMLVCNLQSHGRNGQESMQATKASAILWCVNRSKTRRFVVFPGLRSTLWNSEQSFWRFLWKPYVGELLAPTFNTRLEGTVKGVMAVGGVASAATSMFWSRAGLAYCLEEESHRLSGIRSEKRGRSGKGRMILLKQWKQKTVFVNDSCDNACPGALCPTWIFRILTPEKYWSPSICICESLDKQPIARQANFPM